jgi:ATP phosphoribosyltransferase regulatory subunit
MNYQDRWLLPAGITEILPPETAQLENLRQRLLTLYASWGYELVIPPMIEYLESLLLDRGDALDLQTFKIIDQLTGRLMGIRADMTPQVARIDAHHLRRQVPTRLCYAGTVLHARPNQFAGSRSPLQIGAELYGYEGIQADFEIISLMLETLREVGLTEYHLDVGHVGIYQHLIKSLSLTPTQHQQLSEAIKSKASSDLQRLLTDWQVPQPFYDMLNHLVQLHGDRTVLEEARKFLARTVPEIGKALDDLEQLANQLRHVPLYVDLAETRGYKYHTGLVFAVYVPKHGQAVAKGGRYDISEKLFGRKRPATGFSTYLTTLVSLLEESWRPSSPSAILAPANSDPALAMLVAQLRKEGQPVIWELPHQEGNAKAMGCDRELRWAKAMGWQVVQIG